MLEGKYGVHWKSLANGRKKLKGVPPKIPRAGVDPEADKEHTRNERRKARM